MCGIAGILAPTTAPQSALRAMAVRMGERLVHRGPDAKGVWSENGVALSHRRLSILDLSQAGAQPMLSVCGRFVIVFNGEIYNHLELRRQLSDAGAAPVWRGHSDTETLLAAFVHWGAEETLLRCVGMFACALWDRHAGRLMLARDRIGEKPLYWGWAGDALVFGSELKALRVHPDCPSEICPEALAAYLERSYIPAPYSIHPGIYKLEPGCLLEVTAAAMPRTPPAFALRPGDRYDGISIRRYWSLDDVIEAGASACLSDDKTTIDQLEAGLSAAVGRQLIADVPLGAFLSGGIDSSLVVALMQAQSQRRVQTFTIGFETPEYDESPFAAEVARHLNTDHRTLHVTDAEARDIIPLLPQLYDEPFADSSQIPTHLVCRAARSRVTVALSGDGGDELFGGYNRYILGPRLWRRMAPVPFALRNAIGTAAMALPNGVWTAAGRLYNSRRSEQGAALDMVAKVHRISNRLRRVRSLDDLHHDSTSFWKDPAQLMLRGMTGSHVGPLQDKLPNCLSDDPAGRMMTLDLRAYLPDDMLCKVDRAAMGISLETRAPFLDPEVIKLSAQLPTSMKLRGGQGKWPLRQVLYRYVPRELIERPKAGFSVPLGAWLRGPLRQWADDLLASDNLARDGLLAPGPIRAAWAEHLTGRVDRAAQIWIILMFLAWRHEQ